MMSLYMILQMESSKYILNHLYHHPQIRQEHWQNIFLQNEQTLLNVILYKNITPNQSFFHSFLQIITVLCSMDTTLKGYMQWINI
ncbi:Hypothetical protein CINCED_3A006294 [Cinara cedri]|uniref:Uncharacterized protein n=1 Tax=Cinara cedri TaxID=506608 RepID=A0A5E4M3L7_9HEMI|nr:Hypothetical protein CINCED_3A006294 [Cinara cedri]